MQIDGFESKERVHKYVFFRPTVAGIHAGAEGAYSIALSGGYDDNVDYGECFTYTGEGMAYTGSYLINS